MLRSDVQMAIVCGEMILLWLHVFVRYVPLYRVQKQRSRNSHLRDIGRLLEVGRLQVKSMCVVMKRLKSYKPLMQKYVGVDLAYSQKKTQSWRKQNCIAPTCTDTCTQMLKIRLGGFGGMLPQEKFLKI